MGFLWRIPLAAILIFLIIAIIAVRALSTSPEPSALYATGAVAFGSIIGFIMGGNISNKIDGSVNSKIAARKGERFISSISHIADTEYDQFITFTASITGLYVIMYLRR